jgi:hypothetical protein
VETGPLVPCPPSLFMPPLDDLRKHDLRAAIRKFLRVAAVVSFLAYCLWNVYWLAQGQIPPSIFRSATGLPAPTTGGTRAVIALCRGEALESLRYNAMAIPILLLFTLTIGWPPSGSPTTSAPAIRVFLGLARGAGRRLGLETHRRSDVLVKGPCALGYLPPHHTEYDRVASLARVT